MTSAGAILEKVRATSVSLKRSLSENELVYIYLDYRSGVPGSSSRQGELKMGTISEKILSAHAGKDVTAATFASYQWTS